MLRNLSLVALLCLGLLVIVDAVHRSRPAPAPLPATSARGELKSAVSPPPAPGAVVAPVVAAEVAPETPALDMMARLAIRRRIAREGNQVYLDSLLAHTDSVVTRWPDRRTLTVALVADTALPGWSPALLGEARAAMGAWDLDGAGPAFREVANADSADIKVHWAVVLRDSGQIGVTNLSWSGDGVVHAATITLALRRNTDSAVVPVAVRARAAVHEFGHALGLPHSDAADDIMFRLAPVASPSTRDQATLRLLYAVPPGPLRITQ